MDVYLNQKKAERHHIYGMVADMRRKSKGCIKSVSSKTRAWCKDFPMTAPTLRKGFYFKLHAGYHTGQGCKDAISNGLSAVLLETSTVCDSVRALDSGRSPIPCTMSSAKDGVLTLRLCPVFYMQIKREPLLQSCWCSRWKVQASDTRLGGKCSWFNFWAFLALAFGTGYI